MSGAEIKRFLLFALLAPAFGVVAYTLIFGVLRLLLADDGGTNLLYGLVALFVPQLLVAYYLLGLGPAIVTGLVLLLFTRRTSGGARLLIAIGTGAVTALLGVAWVVVSTPGDGLVPTLVFLLAVAITGALVSLLCAAITAAGKQTVIARP